jgi:NAD(P)-dependent dehydrogenase (short-subunit alcohol dehydrogenase family)
MGRLEGKIALITGATGGQGSAEVKLFCSEGAKVVFGDLDDAKGKLLEEEVRNSAGEATYVHHDVTSECNWQNVVSKAVELYGKIDVLVNNAGFFLDDTFEDTAEEEWDKLFAVNAKSIFFGIKSVIPIMKESGGGSIINIASMASEWGSPVTVYGASKAAVSNLTKSIAVQYGSYGIRCNSVHPGTLEGTDIGDVYLDDPEFYKRRVSQVPLNRIGNPMDIATGVLYLASDESSYVTGLELIVDGGMNVKR